jgi:hypothetical protein
MTLDIAAHRFRMATPVVFRILPREFRAKVRAEGPCGNRALEDGIPPLGPLPKLKS